MNKNINKKIMITGLSCAFLLISGLCYSCTFKDSGKSGLQTTLTDTTPSPKPSQESGHNSTKKQKIVDTPDDSSGDTLMNAEIYVHLCGAVENPGVYRAQDGARLSDLIKLAGGLHKNAAGDYINQAKKVVDGQRVYIPTVEEVSKLSKDQYIEGDNGNNQDTAKQTDSGGDLININTATAEQLMNLPGIGQSKAESIISYRTKNGQYKKVEDVMKISGIKEGLFGKIKSYICVN